MSVRRSVRRISRRSTSEGIGKDLRSRYDKDYKDEEPYKVAKGRAGRGNKKNEKRNKKREVNLKGRVKKESKRQSRKRESDRKKSYKKSKDETKKDSSKRGRTKDVEKKDSSKVDSRRRSKRGLSPNDQEESSKRKKICTRDVSKKSSSKEKSSKIESKDTCNKEDAEKKSEINKPECRPSCSYETGEVEWSPYFDIIFVHCLRDCDLVRLNKNFWRILMRDRFYSMIDIECPIELFEEKLDLYQTYILQKCKKQLAWYPSKSCEFSIPKEWILERGLSVD